ncbi:MAG: DUF4041 domain-containing protein [Phycisphaerales bacterium]
MTLLLGVLLAAAVPALVWLGVLLILARREATKAREHAGRVEDENAKLSAANQRLAKWTSVADADDMARQLIEDAKKKLAEAEDDARILVERAQHDYDQALANADDEAAQQTAEARAAAREATERARTELATAREQAARIIASANERAEQIAGKAYDAVRNAEHYEKTAKAMKNIIDGYGDAYLKPADSLLDDLAEEFSHKDGGKQLKLARDTTKSMVKGQIAAECDYKDPGRRDMAIAFVLDAFNGKVDSILSRVKHDNMGTLEQEIKDAFTIVNHGGQAFRNARLTMPYLNARLAELRWAVIVQELKKIDREEQRRIREQIREEQKAMREYAKAMRDAEKEESTLRKAMARAQQQIDKATAEQRALYEAQLAELNAKLAEAEEKNQRAISMAQQTKRGHVYIISNVGSFGENIYKIGLTRRLEPLDRVKELGDASVPFDFDVHAVIWAEDAPALETQLHKHFLLHQVNKVNHRKEFFLAQLADIRQEIEALGIEAKWTMASEAQQYRETLAIERAIENDPEAREQWLNRQLTLDPVEWAEDGELVGAEEE